MSGIVKQIVKSALRTISDKSQRRTCNREFLKITIPRYLTCTVRQLSTKNTPKLKTERRYTSKHEWVEFDGRIGIIGISHYAQDALGDVVYAQLPEVGTLVKKDEECGVLESVKAASEIISPVTGKVIEKNEAVEAKPGLINSSCYEEGWLFKAELTNPEEVNNLMDENSYNEFLKSDPH